MAEGVSDKPAEPGGKKGLLGRTLGRMAPKAGARQVIGIILLLTIVAVVVAALIFGVERSRTSYFQQRNLRELDRVAANISATSQTLGSVASLYFNPHQLHYALTPATECLMASTRIQRTADLAIDVHYYFVDSDTPSGAPRGTAKKDSETNVVPAPAAVTGDKSGTAAPPAPAPGKVTDEPVRAPAAVAAAGPLCPYDSPVQGAESGDKLTVDGERVRMSKWLLLRDLLRPMTAGAAGADPAATARGVLESEAARRIERGGFGPGAAERVPAVVTRSLQTAFDRNAVRTEVSVGIAALDLDTSLETFDAIQIIGAGEGSSPALLFQAGQLPPAISNVDGGPSRDFLKNILKVSDVGGGGGDAPAKSRRSYQESDAGGSLLMESKVYQADDLMIFDKRYASLGGFACSAAKPCRIIGIIRDQRFGSDVRKFEGMHSTIFLIAVLTLVGLVPMIHLALRKRLDAIGRRVQYVMWFSLTLIAASALIASLTVWAGAISKSESTSYTESEIERLQRGFAAELDASLALVVRLGRQLRPSAAPFPAPPAIHWSNGIPKAGSNAALLDTTGWFRGDGFAARDIARFSDVRTPPFGTNIADRPYFQRLRNGDLATVKVDESLCASGALDFVIDRVVARPDGVAKTIFALPARPGCVDPPGGALAAGPAEEDPARPRLLLASGYLQTFMAANLHPGFHYAVIDPNRPEGQPDILFSDRRSAELAELFERDLDDREEFRTRMDQFRLNEDKGRVRRLATRYRGDPVRLTMTRLHPQVDWVLVTIEGRNDSGFAIWRAATFGYSTWLFAVVAVVLIILAARVWNHKALDRRPGLWLWPADVITDFTPARFAFEAQRRDDLGAAAIRRDLYLRRIFLAGAVGVLAAEGAARPLLAFGLVLAAFAARGYFHGSTSSDCPAARKLDRFFLYAAALLIIFSIATFSGSAWLAPASGETLAAQWPRALVFLGSILFLVEPLGDVLGAACERDSKGAKAAATLDGAVPRRLKHRRRKAEAEAEAEDRKKRLGWIWFLLVIGALPAAGGFLDSIDHDSALVAERTAQHAAGAADARRKALESVEAGRLARRGTNAVEPALRERIARGLLTGEAPPEADREAEAGKRAVKRPWDVTVADLSMRSLDLHEMALSFSDFRAWHMRDGFAAAWRAPVANTFVGLVAMILPFLILLGAFLLFRGQYFTRPPRTPAIDPADFPAPLTAAREQFVDKLLVPAAEGRKPHLPFEKDPSHRHLILGVDMDIREEPELAALEGRMEWVDLLEIADGKEAPKSFKAEVRAVVIGNLDIALQLPDRAQVKRVFDGLGTMIEAAGKSVDAEGRTRRRERHVFLLSDVVPLDRIALLRERQECEEAPTTIEDWRWAALLQDFTLVAVVPTLPLPGVRPSGDPGNLPPCAERELLVINTVFARALLKQLTKPRKADLPADYEDRVIDYVAEQMGDYYHKLWASSSDEERVMLYHIAWRSHLKMTEGPAVRSLLVRGLIVRSPEYRLMNKSFARYVRRIERLERIHKRAADAGGIDKIWPVIRVPLMVFVLALLVIVQLISPRHATGALGIVPALGAIVPALLANWLRLKAAEG